MDESVRARLMIMQVLVDTCLREVYRNGFHHAILGGISRRRPMLRVLHDAWTIPLSSRNWLDVQPDVPAV